MALGTHADMFDHRPGAGHLERPERLRAVIDAIDAASDLDLEARDAPLVDPADLRRVHAAYVAAITKAALAAGRLMLDADTFMSPGSLHAARRAAGAVAAGRAVRVARRARCAAFCSGPPAGPSR